MPALIIIRGGGDLASGVALRLHRAGFRLIITELPQPLVVRRLVSFAEAVYSGETVVEDIIGRRAENLSHAQELIGQGVIPVLVDPSAEVLSIVNSNSSTKGPTILIDGRMTKHPPDLGLDSASLVIGLGPGFTAGENCHAVIETNRGHSLGRVIWHGTAEMDTGLPESVAERRAERVLRAPAAGVLHTYAEICDKLEPGQRVAEVDGQPVLAPFRGVLRGLLHSGLQVVPGLKIGDVDPRNDPAACRLVSDKALAVGGGVLEAVLSRPEIRMHLWMS